MATPGDRLQLLYDVARSVTTFTDLDALLAYEDGDLALEDIERLVLVVVQVQGRPAAARVVGLSDHSRLRRGAWVEAKREPRD